MDVLAHMNQQVQAIQVFSRIFEHALVLFGSEPEWAGRTGVYFCIADERGEPAVIARVGEPTKPEKYLAFCQEKAKRLAAHPEHVSSYQSRNPAQDHWGGAIRANYWLMAPSGAPELGDEALVMGTAWVLRLADEDTLAAIAKYSNNPYWQRLRDSLHR